MRRIGYGIGLLLTSAAGVLYCFLDDSVQRASMHTFNLTPVKVFYWLWPLLFGALLAATLLLSRATLADMVLSGLFAAANLAASLVLVNAFWVFYPVYSQLLAGVFTAAAVGQLAVFLRRRKRAQGLPGSSPQSE
ncbi:MAG TPA: hypothetical protein H9674_08535 [Firmicutes bacterium]|nr:hypothetical protein [Bacillota bacterium]